MNIFLSSIFVGPNCGIRGKNTYIKSILMLLVVVLTMWQLMICPVYATEQDADDFQKIKIQALDDWEGSVLSGAGFSLAEKQDGSYSDIQKDLEVLQTGMDLELDAGEYSLTVTRTPNGYVTAKHPIEFTVTKDGVSIVSADNAEVIAQNDGTFVLAVYYAVDRDLVMPATGGKGVLPNTLGGLLLMVTVAIIARTLHRKNILGMTNKGRNVLSIILAMGMMALMAFQTPISVMAAEKGYTYYVMMKTDPVAEYYVEDETLANALTSLTVEGSSVFEVEKVSNENRWNVMTTDADCSLEDVAEALATIKEQAIATAPLTSDTLELGYGALVLIKTKAGTYFISEVQDSSQSLFERPIMPVDKGDSDFIGSLKFDINNNCGEIGKEVECKLEVVLGEHEWNLHT